MCNWNPAQQPHGIPLNSSIVKIHAFEFQVCFCVSIFKFPILEENSNKFGIPGRGSDFILQLLLHPEVLASQVEKF